MEINFDFRDFGLIPEFNFPGWTKVGTFNVARGDKEIIGYSFDGQMQFGTNTVDSYFFNSNVFNTSNYLQMDGVPVPYTTGQIEVVLDLNATAQTVSQFLTNVTAVKIAVGAVKDGSPTIWLNNNGLFKKGGIMNERKEIKKPLKAIRAKCLDCSTTSDEVKHCRCVSCALHPFRFGKNPYLPKRVMTPDQKEQAIARLKKARESKSS